jgi:predicted transcriptional regulator
MSDSTVDGNFIELTAEIVSAYVSNNTVPAGEIPSLINQVHAALSRVSGKSAEGPHEPLKPARLFGGRKEIQVAQASPAHAVQHDS